MKNDFHDVPFSESTKVKLALFETLLPNGYQLFFIGNLSLPRSTS